MIYQSIPDKCPMPVTWLSDERAPCQAGALISLLMQERRSDMFRHTPGFLRAAAVTAVLGGALFVGVAPAWADTTIPINPGNVPTTASAFPEQSCDQVPGGASSTQDGWVFVLPGNKGSFTSLTLTFQTTTGTT